MPVNKRQHYVPQFYLRYFSDDKKTITVYSIKEKKIVTTNAPIDRQCYENYMYSKNLDVEQVLSELEGAVKIILDKIIKSESVINKDTADFINLMVFILYQYARTKSSADQLNEMVDKVTKIILKDHVELSKPDEITVGDFDLVRIGYEEPALFNLSIISLQVPLVFDLEYKLAINKTNSNFIISDHPVIFYNKYYLNNFFSYSGLASKELLIFYPLTPTYMLIFYDSKMYKVGGKNIRRNVIIDKKEDIDEINKLQVINANETIYPYKMNSSYLNNLNKNLNKYRLENTGKIYESESEVKPNGKSSKLIHSSRPKIMYDINLKFLSIDKKISKKYLDQKLVRDVELVKLHKEFCVKVDNNEYKPSEWGLFLKNKFS